MEPTEPPRGTKRLLPSDDDHGDDGRSLRFPDDKKAKRHPVDVLGAAKIAGKVDIDALMNPEVARARRARHRRMEGGSVAPDLGHFEVQPEYYNDGAASLLDDGDARIEPFNLEQERHEGYFDQDGNFVEHAKGSRKKDAWLDSVEVETKYTKKVQKFKETEELIDDLTSEDVGSIKRRIAGMLEPHETIPKALRRLKASNKDGKMSEGTKRLFDELTENAVKLMEKGEFDVYSHDQGRFEADACVYEGELARARRLVFEQCDQIAAPSSSLLETTMDDPAGGLSFRYASTTTTAVSNDNSGGEFDMFGDDGVSDAKTVKGSGCQSHDASPAISGAEKAGNSDGTTDNESDYAYDPSSGYYYSSSTGYYYDPTSGCYCSASTGTWFSYGQQSGMYNEIHP